MKKNHGVANDALYFKYPLVGTFEFSAETLDDGWMESDITYGGLVAMNHSYQNTVYVHSPPGTTRMYRQKQPWSRTKTFVRKTIRVTPQSVTNLVNGHPVYVDESTSSTASPWVGLFATGYRAAAYRNVRLTGNFTIPREVKLSEDERLRGWLSDNYYQQPNPLPDHDDKVWKTYNRPEQTQVWSWRDGEIIGEASGSPSESMAVGYLQYLRPMNNGENVTWEFFSDAGSTVHPALGHVAYELHDDAVRLRWFSRDDNEPKHLVKIDSEQKGNVGVKPGWNQGRVAIEDDTVQLSINGQPVYEHPLEPNEERKFGFFYDKNKSSARIRNVVLKGDWPTQLTEDQVASLTAPIAKQPSEQMGRAVGKSLGPAFLTRHSLDVVRAAAKLQPDQRFKYLRDWVLSSDEHWAIRAVGDLTPAHPTPPVKDSFVTSDHGGELVSPLLMLVDAAKEVGQLDTVINELKKAAKYQARPATAALVVAHLANDDLENAQLALHQLEERLPRYTDMSKHVRWAELLACHRALEHPQLVGPVFHITTWLIKKQITAGKEGNRAWGQHVRDLHAKAMRKLAGIESNQQALAAVKHWKPVSHATAETNGEGFPEQGFRLSAANELVHLGGFQDDSMYFDVPLRGDFQVDCELTSFDSREFNIGYAGIMIEPQHTKDKVKVTAFRQSETTKPISPKLNVGNWYRYRIIVKNDEMFCFVNDQEVYKTSLPENRDPWLFVTSHRWCQGAIRNFKISGVPTTPKSISPLYDESMTGWSTKYYGDSMGPSSPDQETKNDWHYDVDAKVLKASRRRYLEGVAAESLIQYHRPMLEDGVISYRFTWKPGNQEVHPALGKCVFYLTEDKVRLHWLTDGRYDRTGLAPDNLFDEPENQLVDKLPFIDQGNKLRLELKGDEVTIVLNDTPVFRRTMEATNQRLLGFFHFKGRTMCQVRGLKWTGSWPNELPPATEQPFGGDAVQSLLNAASNLKDSYSCDFTKKDPKAIGVNSFDPAVCIPTENGLKIVGPPNDSWQASGISVVKGMSGDFDVTLEYADLNMVKPEKNASWLRMRLRASYARPIEVWGGFRFENNGKLGLTFERQIMMADKNGVYEPLTEPTKPTPSGRIRFIRKGGEVWCLFAAGESKDFRIVESYIMGAGDIPPGQLHANVLSSHSKQQATATLKSLTIRAEKILH
ncbi:DUF1583 domain-containing protein [bacterium]|nr:DUF1583 domain-containing protein [bacterium]